MSASNGDRYSIGDVLDDYGGGAIREGSVTQLSGRITPPTLYRSIRKQSTSLVRSR